MYTSFGLVTSQVSLQTGWRGGQGIVVCPVVNFLGDPFQTDRFQNEAFPCDWEKVKSRSREAEGGDTLGRWQIDFLFKTRSPSVLFSFSLLWGRVPLLK